MVMFDVPDKFEQDVKALRSNNNSEISIRIAQDSLPDLDYSDINIQAAMGTANESRRSWREKRAYGDRGGGRDGFRDGCQDGQKSLGLSDSS